VYEGLDRSFPVDYKPDHFTTDHSGKLQVLSHILAQIYREGERVVLVSNYTQVKLTVPRTVLPENSHELGYSTLTCNVTPLCLSLDIVF